MLYMGIKIFDQYTYLHFAVGIISYFWNIPFKNWIYIHTIFEIFENSGFGMSIINNFHYWPGGKPRADSNINIIGDTIGTILGWLSAYIVDNIGNKYGLYDLHLKN